MTALLNLVLILIAVTFAFGCMYATWGVLADLFAGWAQFSLRSILPRRFGLRALFAFTAIVAIACVLLEDVRVDGAAQWIAVFAISLAWAAAIVYGFQCMLGECLRRESVIKLNDDPLDAETVADVASNETGSDRPLPNDDPTAELDRWLGQRANEESPKEASVSPPPSTKEVRSHFHLQLPVDPKGVKASGFGRF